MHSYPENINKVKSTDIILVHMHNSSLLHSNELIHGEANFDHRNCNGQNKRLMKSSSDHTFFYPIFQMMYTGVALMVMDVVALTIEKSKCYLFLSFIHNV